MKTASDKPLASRAACELGSPGGAGCSCSPARRLVLHGLAAVLITGVCSAAGGMAAVSLAVQRGWASASAPSQAPVWVLAGLVGGGAVGAAVTWATFRVARLAGRRVARAKVSVSVG